MDLEAQDFLNVLITHPYQQMFCSQGEKTKTLNTSPPPLPMAISTCALFWGKMNKPFVDLTLSHTVDRRDPANQLIGSLSRFSQGFIHPRWLFGISFITVHQAFFTYSKAKDRGFPRIQVYIPSTFGPCVYIYNSPPVRWGLLDFMSALDLLVLVLLLLHLFVPLLRPCEFNVMCRSAGPQPRSCEFSVPDLNHDPVSSVCRTSTTILWGQCGVPDLNHDPVSSVWRARPQPRSCEVSVARRTSTAQSSLLLDRRYVRKNVRRYVRKNVKRYVRKSVRRYARKNVKRYVPKNVRRYARRYSRKNVKRYVRKNVRRYVRKIVRRYVRQNVRKYVPKYMCIHRSR